MESNFYFSNIENKKMEWGSFPYFSGNFLMEPNKPEGLLLNRYSSELSDVLKTNSLSVVISSKMGLIGLSFKKSWNDKNPFLQATLNLSDSHLKDAVIAHDYLNPYFSNMYGRINLPANNSYSLQAMIESVNELTPYFEKLNSLNIQRSEKISSLDNTNQLNIDYNTLIHNIRGVNLPLELISKFPSKPFKCQLELFKSQILEIEYMKKEPISLIISGLQDSFKYFS
mgnify:CR=1 FL=1